MQHNFISDLPARRRRAYFMPSTPKKISALALSAMSAWTLGAAAGAEDDVSKSGSIQMNQAA